MLECVESVDALPFSQMFRPACCLAPQPRSEGQVAVLGCAGHVDAVPCERLRDGLVNLLHIS